uniref:NB-ARC domain-containing protein n=1 Tax=Picea sitchensis TaxID=3332 RepID=A9NWC6_PICSI|nr:unknown [Picea sitchensis]
MVEAAVVCALIDKFTSMVADKLFPEVSLIVNFRKDFEFFRDELFSIQCLLMDAGEKWKSSSVSNWVDSLEDFVADAELPGEQSGPVDNIFAKLIFRLKMGHEIRELDYCPPVIAVVGMGGQGKTLLLQRIFNSEEIPQRFDHQVWLAISQKFDVMELLRQVLREFVEPNFNSTNLNKGELIKKIHKNLEGKRCLFAVDNVWDRDAWEKIGLPCDFQDKVVVTIRDEKVAESWGAGDQILPKNSLSEENS